MSPAVAVSRRRLTLGLLCLALGAFTARAFFGDGGLLDVRRQEKELGVMRARVESARERNKVLQSEIVDLRTGRTALERLARERLGYVAKGEVTYLFPLESSDPPPKPARPDSGSRQR